RFTGRAGIDILSVHPSCDRRKCCTRYRNGRIGRLSQGSRRGLLSRILRLAGVCNRIRNVVADWKTCLPLDEIVMRNRWHSLFPPHVVGAFLLLAATLAASKLTEYRKSE